MLRILFVAILFYQAGLFSAPPFSFVEENGVISIEAEHYTSNVGPWERVEGRNAITDDMAGLGTDSESVLDVRSAVLPGIQAGSIQITREEHDVNWGFPAPLATIAAAFESDAEKAAVFFYENGAALAQGNATARRTGMFSGTPELTAEGWMLWDAALNWTVGGQTAGEALFIVSSTELGDMDKATSERLEQLGFTVKPVEDEAVTPRDAENKALVFVSESVSSGAVADKFLNVSVPVVICEPYVLDDMNMIVSKPRWQEKPGQSGLAMLTRRGSWSDYMRYAIYFENTGIYNLWLLGQSGGDGGSNEVKVFFGAAALKSESDFYEITFSERLAWTNERHYQNPENGPIPATPTVNVTKPGWHNLYLVKGADPEHPDNPPENRRYPNWRVDKILLTTAADKPSGDGPVESLNNGQFSLPEVFAADLEFYPPEIWQEQNGFVVIEAEDIEHHDHWQLKTEPENYTGDGYLEWQGPSRTTSIDGIGGNHDSLGVRQGPQDEWLILRLSITNPGVYSVDVRNHHEREDGDNDAWVSKVGFQPDRHAGKVISRMGDSFHDGEGLTWLDWGVREFELQKGINNLYIGGRSIGFGIDRIVIYKTDDEKAREKAMDLSTPPSRQHLK